MLLRKNVKTCAFMLGVILTIVTFSLCAYGNVTKASKDKLRVGVTGDILTVDPQVAQGTQAEIARMHMYEGLVYLDENNEIKPCLAEKWEVAEDGKSYIFHLKKGVKFHDGTDFNARAVKRTFDRLLNQEYGSNRKTDYLYIEEVEVIDDYTVRFVLSEPRGNILNLLAYGGGFIISPAAIEKYKENLGTHAVGTGPYKLKEMVTGEYVKVERNDEYWGEKPKIREIEFISVKEEMTRVAMLEVGELDYALAVPPHMVDRLENKGIAVTYNDSNRVAHIGFNTRKPPFDNVKVRMALNYAINKDMIVEGVLGGLGVVANSIVAPNTWGYYDPKLYSYNPEKARELLKEAGYPNGFSAKLFTPQGRYFRDKETAIAIADQLKDIGVTLKVEVVDWGVYLKELRVPVESGKNKVEAYLLAWECITREAGHIVNSIFNSINQPPNGWNTMFYFNPEVDKLDSIANATVDPNRRLEYFKELQLIIAEDAPWVPLYSYKLVNGHRSDLKGVIFIPTEIPLFYHAYYE